MPDLYMTPGTAILSIDRNSVYIFFMSSEKLGISQSNFETLIKVQKAFLQPLKLETSVHSQIAVSRHYILIRNFLTWQRRIITLSNI